MQRRTDGGHPDGFWAVNTLAMHIEWDVRGENTKGAREITTRDINRGLTLDSYGDRIVVTAHDFLTNTELRQVTIPNPLVEFAAEIAPDSERDADYAAVDAVLSTVPADLSSYTAESVAALQQVIDSLVYELTADRRSEVDAFATAIAAALDWLVKIPAAGGAQPVNPVTPDPGTPNQLASTGGACLGWSIAGMLTLLGAGSALLSARSKSRRMNGQ